jgi:hypothetical protein
LLAAHAELVEPVARADEEVQPVAELFEFLDAAVAEREGLGLNAPADPATPGIPDGLVLAAGPAGSIYADWADARRAERYHVLKQVVGTDAEPVRVATVDDSDATLTGLPTGATVKITVKAVNAAGDSLPCDPVETVVP